MMRVATRVEGNWVRAYLANLGSMEGAVELASVRAECIAADGEVGRMFHEMTKRIGALIFERAFGEEPELLERPAPEHEKAGRA